MQLGGPIFQGMCYAVLFLLTVVVLANVTRKDVRQSVLLIASFALYLTWAPWFAAVLCTSIVVNFLIGKWLSQRPHLLPLSLGVAFNLLLLSVFKYLPEAAGSLRFSALERFASLALPLGISFWTFQALSYLFDQYREERLDPSLPEFALYMAFFPVTIAGPVCRMPDMLPQFRSESLSSPNEIGEGLRRIATGVFMMQVAKLLGQGIPAGDGITRGFDRIPHWSGADAWCLAFGYGLQLFFDFAGYSHIAIGAAKALGISVPANFDRPFASTNPSIFWTRWHMSLSFWIRDYVFFPLAALRREIWWRYLALALSMVAFGIWHKATLLFLIWGTYHGVLLVLHRQLQQVQRRFQWDPTGKPWTVLSLMVTAVVISLGWIFFRSNSFSQALEMIKALFSFASYSQHFLPLSLYYLVAGIVAGYAIVVYIASKLEWQGFEPVPSTSGIMSFITRWRWFWIPSVYALALLFVFLVTHGQEASAGQLMYRQF